MPCAEFKATSPCGSEPSGIGLIGPERQGRGEHHRKCRPRPQRKLRRHGGQGQWPRPQRWTTLAGTRWRSKLFDRLKSNGQKQRRLHRSEKRNRKRSSWGRNYCPLDLTLKWKTYRLWTKCSRSIKQNRHNISDEGRLNRSSKKSKRFRGLNSKNSGEKLNRCFFRSIRNHLRRSKTRTQSDDELNLHLLLNDLLLLCWHHGGLQGADT